MPPYMPLGDLMIRFRGHDNFTDYRRLGSASAERRTRHGCLWKGPVDVRRVRVLPPTACRRSGRVASFRESAQPRREAADATP
jgi:hypothetical protein